MQAEAACMRRASHSGLPAAVKRLLDCSLGRVGAAIDDLLRAWYKDRVKGLLGVVRATCHVLEGGRRRIGKARTLLSRRCYELFCRTVKGRCKRSVGVAVSCALLCGRWAGAERAHGGRRT